MRVAHTKVKDPLEKMRSFVRYTLFCLLWNEVLFTQAQDSCGSLQHYVDTHPNCQIYSCSGVSCDDNITYVNFIVQKCEDPVTVDVFMYNYNGAGYLSYLFNQSETVTDYDGSKSFTAIMDRNASHLGFELHWIHQHEEPQWLFDAVYTPLDVADCMCGSMQSIADSLFTSFCHVNDPFNCTKIHCTVFDSPLQSVNLTFHPCDSPPSLDLDIDLWTTVYRIHANDNTTRSLDNGVSVQIDIWHFDYSMDVQIAIISATATFDQFLLSRHKIILDLTDCGPPRPFNLSSESTEPPTVVTEPTFPATTDSSYNTCSALNSISLVNGNLCSTNRECNALECEIGNQQVEMAIDSCHHPPGIRVAMYDNYNQLLYNRTLYNGSHIIHGSPVILNITIQQFPPSAISIEVRGSTFGKYFPFIPRTVIPIDSSSWSTLPPSTTPPSTTPPSTTPPPTTPPSTTTPSTTPPSTTPPPTSGPTATCSAMHSIQSAFARPIVCSFPIKNNCTVLFCHLDSALNMTIYLLRCAHPPAVRVTLESSGLTYFNHTFDHSEVVPMDKLPGPNDRSLNVTLDHLCPNDIGFDVSGLFRMRGVYNLQVNLLSGGYNSPFIPYTIIPVNTTGCGPSDPGQICPSVTTMAPSLSHTTGSSTHGHSTGPSTSSTTQPTPVPSLCDTMKRISDIIVNNLTTVNYCKLNSCNEIDCFEEQLEWKIILQCSPQIGIKMILVNTTQDNLILESQLFMESGTWFYFYNVTVDNMDNRTLGFGMNFSDIPLITYTLIPLDSCTDSNSPSSNTNTGPSTAVVVSAVVVPVVVLILIIAVIVIITGVYLIRRRRLRDYHFHRMAMTELKDEDC